MDDMPSLAVLAFYYLCSVRNWRMIDALMHLTGLLLYCIVGTKQGPMW